MMETPTPLSTHKQDWSHDQVLITVTSRDATFTDQDERIQSVLECLARHKVRVNVHWFKEQKLMLCVGRKGEQIDQAGKELRLNSSLDYSSDAGFAYMRIHNFTPDCATLLPEGEEEICRLQNGNEICVVVRLPKEERVRRRRSAIEISD